MLARPQRKQSAAGYRHGRRDRQLLGSFGPVTFSVPRARLAKADGEPGMAQPSAAALRADDEAGRGADRGRLSVRHQHAPGAPGSGSAVQGRGRRTR